MVGSRVRSLHKVGSRGTILLGTMSLLLVGPVGVARAQVAAISCGATVVASIALEVDLVDCPTDGLIVGADNITIDLNGHTIDGPGTTDFRWDGIDNGAGHDGVTIVNGTLQDFGGDGVYLDNGATRNHLADLILTDNFIGVEVYGSSDSTVETSSAVGNHGEGIVVNGSAGILIANNTISNSHAENQVLLYNAHDTLIKWNRMSGGVSAGVQSLLGTRNDIIKNALSGRGITGVGVFMGSTDSRIAQNEISKFEQTAVYAGEDRIRIEKNTLHDSGLGVILLGNPSFCCPTEVVVRRNEAFNTDVGIVVRDMTDTLVKRNVTHDNRIGIGVRDSTETVLLKNRSDHNAEDGIQILDPATTVTNNSANVNGDLGIEAVEGVTDGGGNKARGNGNPAQCVNVDCSTGGG